MSDVTNFDPEAENAARAKTGVRPECIYLSMGYKGKMVSNVVDLTDVNPEGIRALLMFTAGQQWDSYAYQALQKAWDDEIDKNHKEIFGDESG